MEVAFLEEVVPAWRMEESQHPSRAELQESREPELGVWGWGSWTGLGMRVGREGREERGCPA